MILTAIRLGSQLRPKSTRAITTTTTTTSSIFNILPEVKEALQKGKPVVALESTILSHGLPYPENKQLSKDISKIIRSKGAIPATIAVKDGVCQVGLTMEELDDLVVSGLEGRATKCSTRDLPFLLARRSTNIDSPVNGTKYQWGATTVASTMRLAHLAGISTFVTGGTGGVHRGAEITMDISADLIELSRTPVVVVSAGVKSILDINKTLETLETYGVPTASYQTNEFPAFFSPSSGVTSPVRVDSADEVARAYHASLELGLTNGMLIAVPNNDPAGESVEIAIRETLEEANRLGIQGREVTPFILKKVSERTDGDSLRSNTALVKRNAEIGTDIAVSIAKRENKYNGDSVFLVDTSTPSDNIVTSKARVVVVGGAVVDIVAKSSSNIIPATSNPGSCVESDGGVGRNIAEVLGQLGAKPLLFTAVGDDSRGKALRQRMEDDYDIPKDRQHIKVVGNFNTATYLAILNDDGDLHNAIADMDVLDEIPSPNDTIISDAEYLVIDANLPIEKLAKVVQTAKKFDTIVVFDPTSVPKAALLKERSDISSCISLAFPNMDELLAMTRKGDIHTRNDSLHDNDFEILKDLTVELLEKMHPKLAYLVVTLGPNGAFFASKDSTTSSSSRFEFKHFPGKVGVPIKNCTGAGDTMVGVVVKCLLDGQPIVKSIEKGMDASIQSLKFADGAIPKFSSDFTR